MTTISITGSQNDTNLILTSPSASIADGSSPVTSTAPVTAPVTTTVSDTSVLNTYFSSTQPFSLFSEAIDPSLELTPFPYISEKDNAYYVAMPQYFYGYSSLAGNGLLLPNYSWNCPGTIYLAYMLYGLIPNLPSGFNFSSSVLNSPVVQRAFALHCEILKVEIDLGYDFRHMVRGDGLDSGGAPTALAATIANNSFASYKWTYNMYVAHKALADSLSAEIDTVAPQVVIGGKKLSDLFQWLNLIHYEKVLILSGVDATSVAAAKNAVEAGDWYSITSSASRNLQLKPWKYLDESMPYLGAWGGVDTSLNSGMKFEFFTPFPNRWTGFASYPNANRVFKDMYIPKDSKVCTGTMVGYYMLLGGPVDASVNVSTPIGKSALNYTAVQSMFIKLSELFKAELDLSFNNSLYVAPTDISNESSDGMPAGQAIIDASALIATDPSLAWDESRAQAALISFQDLSANVKLATPNAWHYDVSGIDASGVDFYGYMEFIYIFHLAKLLILSGNSDTSSQAAIEQNKLAPWNQLYTSTLLPSTEISMDLTGSLTSP